MLFRQTHREMKRVKERERERDASEGISTEMSSDNRMLIEMLFRNFPCSPLERGKKELPLKRERKFTFVCRGDGEGRQWRKKEHKKKK